LANLSAKILPNELHQRNKPKVSHSASRVDGRRLVSQLVQDAFLCVTKGCQRVLADQTKWMIMDDQSFISIPRLRPQACPRNGTRRKRLEDRAIAISACYSFSREFGLQMQIHATNATHENLFNLFIILCLSLD